MEGGEASGSWAGASAEVSQAGPSGALAEEEVEPAAAVDPWDLAVERERQLQLQKHKIGLVLLDRWRIEMKIGLGTYGSIYSARDVGDERVKAAVKFEQSLTKPSGEAVASHLPSEAHLYEVLQGGPGFPTVSYCGSQLGYNIMVMDLLGPNLEQLHSFCEYRFTLPTVCHLARAMIRRLQWVHERGYLHRDVKSANFLIGATRETFSEVYLIDYGLAKAWRVERAEGGWAHLEFRDGRSMVGTARYASVNSHLGLELSRRDDLEALGYVLVSFALGTLPWHEIKAKSRKQRYKKMHRMKLEFVRGERLKKLPAAFGALLRYSQRLGFAEEPDYDWLVAQFELPPPPPAQAAQGLRLDWLRLLDDPRRLQTWDVMFKWTQPRSLSAPSDPAPSHQPTIPFHNPNPFRHGGFGSPSANNFR